MTFFSSSVYFIDYAVLYKIKGNLHESTEFVVREGTKGISEYAFCTEDINSYGFYTSGDSNLVKVVLPEGIEYIGQCAFRGCVNLAEINLPEKLYQISNSVFGDYEKLNNVILPENLEIVESDVFSGCSSLDEITKPEYVERNEWGALEGCESLKKITILSQCLKLKILRKRYVISVVMMRISIPQQALRVRFTVMIKKYAEKHGYNVESLGKSYIKGDCNDDCTVNITDTVMLQKFLLGNGSLNEWKNAYLCEDEHIDAFDMILMRKLIICRMDS